VVVLSVELYCRLGCCCCCSYSCCCCCCCCSPNTCLLIPRSFTSFNLFSI